MNVPKTPYEYDYDLWTTEDGKRMVRVKRTGEVTEVDVETFRFLRAEEKALRREYKKSQIVETQDSIQTRFLSIESLTEREEDFIPNTWQKQDETNIDQIFPLIYESEFLDLLTKDQREVYRMFVQEKLNTFEIAERRGTSYQSVQKIISLIRKKAKIFFF